MTPTKFPVSSARRCYFQIEAGLYFFYFFTLRAESSICPARLLLPPLWCQRLFLLNAKVFEAHSGSAGVFVGLMLPSGVWQDAVTAADLTAPLLQTTEGHRCTRQSMKDWDQKIRETRTRDCATCGEKRVNVRVDTPEGIPAFTHDAAQTRSPLCFCGVSRLNVSFTTNLALSYIYRAFVNQ